MIQGFLPLTEKALSFYSYYIIIMQNPISGVILTILCSPFSYIRNFTHCGCRACGWKPPRSTLRPGKESRDGINPWTNIWFDHFAVRDCSKSMLYDGIPGRFHSMKKTKKNYSENGWALKAFARP